MAKEFFKDLPNTTTPLTASRLNGLLDGEEAMGNLVVDSIRSKNILNTFSFIKGRITPSSSGGIVNASGTTSLSATKNSITFTTNIAWNNGVASGFIPVEAGNYTYSATSDKKVYYYVDTYNSSKTWISRIVEANHTGAGNRTFTIGNGVAYIRFHYETDSANTYTITNPQIEKGSTATTFYPYQYAGENDAGWVNINIDTNLLENFGWEPLAYRIIGNVVYIHGGAIAKASLSNQQIVASSLPRPRQNTPIIAGENNNNAFFNMLVSNDGDLRIVGGMNNGSEFLLNASYIIKGPGE